MVPHPEACAHRKGRGLSLITIFWARAYMDLSPLTQVLSPFFISGVTFLSFVQVQDTATTSLPQETR